MGVAPDLTWNVTIPSDTPWRVAPTTDSRTLTVAVRSTDCSAALKDVISGPLTVVSVRIKPA